MTEPPASITYSSVVSRESFQIALLVAALNGLDVMCADIQNAYLHAPCREKIWTIAGPEFGSDEGSVMIVVRALNGLNLLEQLFDQCYQITYMKLGINHLVVPRCLATPCYCYR
jgi:hypothetical protein